MALFLDPLFAVTDVEACPKYETKGAPPSSDSGDWHMASDSHH